MTTKYGRSPWIDRFPKSRVPSYARYRGETTTDVVIVGGGLTGCTTAYAMAVSGLDVVLLEAEQIARGSTGSANGWISEDPGAPFADIAKLHGVRAARRVWQAWRRAALDFGALLRRLQIKCYYEPAPGAIVAATPDDAAWVTRDRKSRLGAGLEAPALTSRVLKPEFGINAAGGLRLKDGAIFDPYRAALGLASAAADRGARLFERTPVHKIAFDRKTATVLTAAGSLHTRRVVIATGGPTPLFRALARHFSFRAMYAALTDPIPAKIRRQLSARHSVIRDTASPPHVVRWVDGERLLVSGADQETPPARQREGIVVQRTGQLMYELSLLYPEISGIQPAYGWDAPYVRAADALPYIGPHRNFPHQLFAWGGSSATVSYLASRVLLRHVTGETEPADEVFGFGR